jgi:regulator of replication initiation timing
LGIANNYEIKFNKLWNQFETVVMDLVRENKMLNEECAALREQLEKAEKKNAKR